MAFVVEDGTGKVDANSYATLAFADNYFLERNITIWDTYTDDQKQAALILATDYIEMRFGSQFAGYRLYPDNPQALSFPRKDVYNVTIVTDKLVKATCEYALRAAQGSLVSDIASTAIVPKKVKIGEIETETNTAYNSKRPDLFNTFPTADLLIKIYLKSNSSQVIR